MREKIQRFMIGRYGADELAKAQSIAALVLPFFVDVQPSWQFFTGWRSR